MQAFEAAVALGYRYLETDVRTTLDGVLVAFHDATLDRVTDRRGAVADLPFSEVRAADAGFRCSTDGGHSHPFRGRGCAVPTLQEILVRWPAVRVNIDCKSDSAVAPLADLLKQHDAYERVCVGSFSDARIARFRRLTRGAVCTSMARRAAGVARLASLSRVRAPRMGADCMQVPLRWGRVPVVDGALLSSAHRAGLPVHVWTVDDAPTMCALLDMGVDGIMTDRPRVLRDVLVARGLWA